MVGYFSALAQKDALPQGITTVTPQVFTTYVQMLINKGYTFDDLVKVAPQQMKTYLEIALESVYTKEEIAEASPEKLQAYVKQVASLLIAQVKESTPPTYETAESLPVLPRDPKVLEAALTSITAEIKASLKGVLAEKVKSPIAPPTGQMFSLFAQSPKTPTAVVTETPTPPVPQLSQADRIALIEQIASQIVTVTTKDLRETIIDIKYPPLFAGSRLTVSQYQQAPGEFNLTFENLSPQARKVLESELQQNTLQHALLDKGYKIQVVQIQIPEQKPFIYETPVTTTTTSSRDQQSSSGETGQGDLTKKKKQR